MMLQILCAISAATADPHHTAYVGGFVANSAPEEEPLPESAPRVLSETAPRVLSETACSEQTSTCTLKPGETLGSCDTMCPGSFCSAFYCGLPSCDFACNGVSSASTPPSPPSGADTSGGSCVVKCGVESILCAGSEQSLCKATIYSDICTWLEAGVVQQPCPPTRPPPPTSPPFGSNMPGMSDMDMDMYKKCPVRATVEPPTFARVRACAP